MSRNIEAGVKSLLGYKLKKAQYALAFLWMKHCDLFTLASRSIVLAQLELKPGISN